MASHPYLCYGTVITGVIATPSSPRRGCVCVAVGARYEVVLGAVGGTLRTISRRVCTKWIALRLCPILLLPGQAVGYTEMSFLPLKRSAWAVSFSWEENKPLFPFCFPGITKETSPFLLPHFGGFGCPNSRTNGKFLPAAAAQPQALK